LSGDSSAGTAEASLFNHFIGAGEKGSRNCEPSALADLRLMTISNLVATGPEGRPDLRLWEYDQYRSALVVQFIFLLWYIGTAYTHRYVLPYSNQLAPGYPL